MTGGPSGIGWLEVWILYCGFVNTVGRCVSGREIGVGVKAGCLTVLKMAAVAAIVDYSSTGGRCTSCRLCPIHSKGLIRVRCTPKTAEFAL